MDLDGSWIPIPKTPGRQTGGVRAAETIVDEYFSSSAPLTYKETRNALQGGKLSTGLSAYLAHGCLSPLSLNKYGMPNTFILGEKFSNTPAETLVMSKLPI